MTVRKSAKIEQNMSKYHNAKIQIIHLTNNDVVECSGMYTWILWIKIYLSAYNDYVYDILQAREMLYFMSLIMT